MTFEPPHFQATGKGYFNKLPNLAAKPGTANGRLLNQGLRSSHAYQTLYLFVTDYTTGWMLGGRTTQTHNSRTFYPRNLSQEEVRIEGVVANQYEYDRLTAFVNVHHNQATRASNVVNTTYGPAIDFSLYPDQVATGKIHGKTQYRTIHNGAKVQGYITAFEAGHRRFVNAPTWAITLRVSYDYISNPVDLQGILDAQLKERYIHTFGNTDPKSLRAPKGDGFTTNPHDDNPDFWDSLPH